MSRKQTLRKDAIDLLIEDHQRISALFAEFERFAASRPAMDARTRRELMAAVCAELRVHTCLEEEIFYPAVREALADGDRWADEAELEHATARALLDQLENDLSGAEIACGRFRKLGEYIAAHVREEEIAMFPQIRKTSLDLHAMAAQMCRRKEELVFEMAEPPAPVTGTFAAGNPLFYVWSRLRGVATFVIRR